MDCPELRWWFIVPETGECSLFANYTPIAWQLSEVHKIEAVRPVSVHDVDGIELEIQTWEPRSGWSLSTWEICGRLTESTTEYLAVSQLQDSKRLLHTFLDEDFEFNWGQMPRRLEDCGRFATQEDGSLKQVHSQEDMEASGAGVFSVSIGTRNFTCLRVFQFEGPLTSFDASITESYVTAGGRTVMVRQFCRPEMAMCDGAENSESVAVDNDLRRVIDGVTYVHWYDSFSNLAFGF